MQVANLVIQCKILISLIHFVFVNTHLERVPQAQSTHDRFKERVQVHRVRMILSLLAVSLVLVLITLGYRQLDMVRLNTTIL